MRSLGERGPAKKYILPDSGSVRIILLGPTESRIHNREISIGNEEKGANRVVDRGPNG